MKKLFALTLIFSTFLASTSFAQGQVQIDEVKNFISKVGNDIINIANQNKLSESDKKQQIIATIDKSIDATWIARFVLGKNYRTANDKQKEHFTKLYRDFMINTYGPKFKNYNGRKFTVNKIDQQGRFYIARAEFLPKDSNTPVLVDFRVKKRKGKLVILDFIAEGVSLIETQRSEFNSVISQKGMDDFLDHLAQRVKKLQQ